MSDTRANPNTSLISEPLWRFWTRFDAYDQDHILDEEILLSGIFADKEGYHNTVLRNKAKWPKSYSLRYASDLNFGPKDKSRAIDLTFKSAQSGNFKVIIRYTKKLFDAYKVNDPRLKFNGKWILREALGTLDGKNAVGLDYPTGKITPRNKSHTWHIHLSVFAEFVDNWAALAQILDILCDGAVSPTTPPIDNWTERLVNNLPVLRKGTTDARSTKVWQGILVGNGFSVKQDGDFGADTEAKTKALQKKLGADRGVDGVVGPETWVMGLTGKDLV